ncbi:MAG: M13 family metallopeptidase [Acidobacteria bacterium]|nr:M13 family metallopeptidase [Acidobacteriota bacterium]
MTPLRSLSLLVCLVCLLFAPASGFAESDKEFVASDAPAGPAASGVVSAATTTSASSDNSLTSKQIAKDVLDSLDRSADPCVDFYRFSCGNWLDTTEMPSDQSRWGRSFSVIREGNRKIVREILDEARANPGSDPDSKRVGYFYGSCMDEAAIEKAGTKPLEALFREVNSVKDAASLLKVTGKLHRRGIDVLFDVDVFPDFKNPTVNISFMSQGGLGMPDRDYYLSDDEKKKELLMEYEKHVARMFGLVGDDAEAAKRQAATVLAFETELAKVSRSREEMRQIEKLYNKIDIAGLKKLTPKLPWDEFLAATGYPEIVDISVATPEFFERLEELVGETDFAKIRTYLRWHVVDETVSMMPAEFVNANFDFFGKKLQGTQELEPRWKRCVDFTQAVLGEVVGKVYVKMRFAGDSKEKAVEMINDIQTAFENALPHLKWMDETTRARAIEKKAAIRNKIGYPDEWIDYSSMKLKSKGFSGNVQAAIGFHFDREAKKIGNPVDKKEWLMTPQMVNAYYHPLLNEIAFPAGILQPPFFHRNFPAAMNYGGIGGVIGHELTHGFDDQGRKFDPSGKMNEWWEPEATESFKEVASCVEEAYSEFEIEPGINVNGKLTLGENIADIGGLKEAYDAYKLWEKRHGAPEPIVEGLTNEQLLFVAWGQSWCTLATPESARLRVTTDTHSPPQFRVTGPVSYNPAFAKVFGCKEGQPMRPKNQCEVW